MTKRAGGTRRLAGRLRRRARRRSRAWPSPARRWPTTSTVARRPNVAKYAAKKECQPTAGLHGLLRPQAAPGQPATRRSARSSLRARASGVGFQCTPSDRDQARSLQRSDPLRDVSRVAASPSRPSSRKQRCEGRAAGPPLVVLGDTRLRSAAPRVMGIVNVTPDSFSDGGLYPRPGARRSRTAASSPPRAPTCSTSAASRPARGRRRSTRPSELERVAPVVEALAATRRARRSRSTPRRPRSPRRRSTPARAIVNDVTALRADPELAGALRRARLRGGADAHAGHPADDAGRPALRRRRRRRPRLPRRADRGGGRRGRRRGADLGRSGDRLRQDRRAQPRAAAAARRAARARPADRRRRLAQELPRRDHRPRGRRTGSAARSPRTCSRCAAGADVLPRPRRRRGARRRSTSPR